MIGVFVVIATAKTSIHDDLRISALEFDRHWDTYIRKLFGCDLKGPTTPETCLESRATVDYMAFKRSRERAKKVFDLVERDQR